MRKWLIVNLLALAALAASQTNSVTSPILRDANSKAKAENKVLFISFSASWCGPCRLLHKTLEHNPVKPIWDKYFTSVSVVVDEMGDKTPLNTPGGNELRTKLNGDKCGIPFFAFLTPEGKVLGNSLIDPKNQGSNMGCPVTPLEIAAFMKTLKAVVPKMSETERTQIEETFKKGSNELAAH